MTPNLRIRTPKDLPMQNKRNSKKTAEAKNDHEESKAILSEDDTVLDEAEKAAYDASNANNTSSTKVPPPPPPLDDIDGGLPPDQVIYLYQWKIRDDFQLEGVIVNDHGEDA